MIPIAHAEIRQTFDTEGNCTSLIMAVDCDVLDSPEACDEVTRTAVTLWRACGAEDDSPPID